MQVVLAAILTAIIIVLLFLYFSRKSRMTPETKRCYAMYGCFDRVSIDDMWACINELDMKNYC